MKGLLITSFHSTKEGFKAPGGERYPLADAIIACGLPPEKLLHEYPETMARALLNAGLLRRDMPPRWILEMFEGIGTSCPKPQPVLSG